MESESLQGAVGGAWSHTGTIPKPQRSELPIPEKLSGQQSNAEGSAQTAEIPSEIRSSINVALFQAQETYRTAMSTQLSEFHSEIRREMLAFMLEIQNTVKSSRLGEQAPPNPVQEPAVSVPPAHGAAPNYANNWIDSRALETQQRQQAGYRDEQQNQRGPPEPNTSGRTQSWKDPGQVRRWNLTFDGSEKSMPVKEFIFRVEHMQRVYQLPWAEVIRDFHLLVAGRARDWFWMHARTGQMMDWPNLRYSLQKQDECHDAEKWVANRWSRPVGSQPPLRPFKERHQVQEVYASEPEGMPDEEPAEAVEALYRPRPGGGEKANPLVCWNCAQGGHTFWECESPMPVGKQSPGQDKSGGVMLCRPSNPIDTSSNCMLAISDKNKEQIRILRSRIIQKKETHLKEPKWSVRQPVEERQAAYDEARARIFKQNPTEEQAQTEITPRVQRARSRYRSRSRERRRVCDSVKMAVNGDKRAFAEIQLQGRLLVGLLDTGASVSFLGAGGPELIEQLGLKMTPSTTTVQAAGGTKHRIIGKINATIKFANKERFLTLYVCPSLQQSLYLGIDFWRKFGLAPSIVGVEALDQVESEFLTKSEPVEPHILDAARQEKLEEVKSQFRSYEREGLGKTHVEQHTIQLVDGAVPIEHRKGKDNVVADMLSRPFEADELNLFDFETTAFESEEYLKRLKVVEEHQEQFPDLRIEEGLLFKRTQFAREDREEFQWKLWIPEAIASTLVQQAHEGEGRMHGGVGKTLARLQQFYYWPRMTVQVRQYVLGCETCKETKHTTQITRPPMGKEVLTDRPMQKLYLDFLGKYPRSRKGNAYILIALDHFTKFVWLRAITSATALATVKILKDEIFSHFGVPEVIHTDNGKQFTSQEFAALMQHHGIKHLRTGNYSAQANASERVNQSVLAAIRTHVNKDQTTWDEKLPEIQAALCSAVHASTGVSPYFAMFGQNMFTHGTDYALARKLGALEDALIAPLARSEKQQIYRARIQETLHRAYERAERTYNLKTRSIKYLPGQEVYKRNFVLSDFRRNVNSKFCRNLKRLKQADSAQLRALVDSVNAQLASLKIMGTQPEILEAIISHLVCSKLDDETIEKWEDDPDSLEIPSWTTLSQFLIKRGLGLANREFGQPNVGKGNKGDSKKASLAATVGNTNMRCTDIAKMYRQVLIHESHRNYQCILWRNDSDEPVHVLRLKTVTYGTSAAPFLAVRCLTHLADMHAVQYPIACAAIRRCFYMDDMLCGSDTIPGLISLKQEVSELLAKGGFELHKWRSNWGKEEVTQEPESREHEERLQETQEQIIQEQAITGKQNKAEQEEDTDNGETSLEPLHSDTAIDQFLQQELAAFAYRAPNRAPNRINNRSVKDAYPVPRVRHILDQLREAHYITSLDLKDVYWQITMEKDGKTLEEHMANLKEVFRRLRAANLRINVDKCDFFKQELKYLGHKVTEHGICTDPEKVEAISKLKPPTNAKELRQYHGVAS
ncbi:hypothetical protein ACLKA6_002314 [Drosophila palustris]